MRRHPELVSVDLGAVTVTYDVQKPLNVKVLPCRGQRYGVERTVLEAASNLVVLLTERHVNPSLGDSLERIEIDTRIRRELVFLREQEFSPTANRIIGFYQKEFSRLLSPLS